MQRVFPVIFYVGFTDESLIASSFAESQTAMQRIILPILAAAFASSASAQDSWDDRTGQLAGSSSTPSHSAYIGGRFLVSSSGSTFWHSAAGTAAWSSSFLPGVPGFYATRGMATDGSKLLIAGTSNTLYSTTSASVSGLPSTPITWTKTSPSSRSVDFRRVRYLNGQFFLTLPPYNDSVDYNNNSYTELLTSTDGETWISRKYIANTTGNLAFTLYDIAFKPGASSGTGTYVLTSNNIGVVLTAPEDLSSLTRVNVSGLSSSGQGVVYGGGVFVMFTQNGKIYTSPTGGVWTLRTLPIAPSRINDVFHDGTEFVAVGNTVGSTPAILRSTDGSTWTAAATVPATGKELFTVTKADGLWLSAGSTRSLLTSGMSSVSPPTISPIPSTSAANTGGTFTLSATIGGAPAPTAIEWRKNNVTLANGTTASGSVVSGADTASLTITGVTLADAGSYTLLATNPVSTTTSNASALSVSAAANGAVLTPYGLDNSLGGTVIPGSAPAKTILGINAVSTFTAASGITYLPNAPANYSYFGAINPAGTKLLLGNPFTLSPIAVYDLATQAVSLIPLPAFPLGPIPSASNLLPSAIADNGDIAGVINYNKPDFTSQLYAFHYSAATQTYTVLGNVPNAGNEIATSIGGISSDGTTLSGYERNGAFDGPFVWTTTGGFTLLPNPTNGGFPNGDIRQISPNGRFIVGFGAAPFAAGGGQAAMRWDRISDLPVGFSLPKSSADTFADARCVNDDGTVGGNVRRGFSFNDNLATVWLANGALIVLPDYLASRYGLTTPGFILNQVTSISSDLRTIAGTATNSKGFSEGWLLTLPDPISVTDPQPEISVRANSVTTNGATLVFGQTQIGSGIYPAAFSYILNTGTAELSVTGTSITGTNAADFTVVNAPPSGLAGTYGINESVAFEIRFNPQPGAAGTRVAAFTVASDDPGTPSFTINLSGTAIAAATPAETALLAYLTDANVPFNQRGPLVDPDGDGVNNLLEFALGLPPMAHSVLPVAENAGGLLSLTYTRAQTTHVSYVVKVSSDMGVTDPWTEIGVDQGIPDGNGVTTATVPIIATPRFLRIEVALVP